MSNTPHTFELPAGVTELTIREGRAATINEPQQFVFSGLLSAPGDFYLKRRDAKKGYFDPAKAVVLVDYDKKTIQLLTDPTDPLADHITGTLYHESKLAPFRINQGSVWKPRDLAIFLRRNRQYFDDKDKAAQLVAELMNMKIKTSGEIDIKDDQRANTKRLFSQKTVTTIPVSFQLSMPIISGEESRKFTVDIHLEVQGTNVDISLESIDLSEKVTNDVEVLMKKEINVFGPEIPILFR